jgi:hypothetical protein
VILPKYILFKSILPEYSCCKKRFCQSTFCLNTFCLNPFCQNPFYTRINFETKSRFCLNPFCPNPRSGINPVRANLMCNDLFSYPVTMAAMTIISTRFMMMIKMMFFTINSLTLCNHDVFSGFSDSELGGARD